MAVRRGEAGRSAVPRPKILVVDDMPANLFAMRSLLSRLDAEIVEARSGNEALAQCLEHRFALILLDVNMPEMDGFEVAALLNDEDRTRGTPIIFVTAAYADDLNRLRGYDSGAVDYIAKPVNDTILLSKVRVFLELYASRAELAERNRQLEAEIVERQRMEAQMRHMATHDMLTGLPNRVLLLDTLERATARAARSKNDIALMYIDIDGFKTVNDRHGHGAGDALLKMIAQRLSETLRAGDTVARIGGDEFAVVLEGPGDLLAAVECSGRLCTALAAPFMLTLEDGSTVEAAVSGSIGIAIYPRHAQTSADLIRAADHAMYRAKNGGKNRSVVAEAEDAGIARLQ